MSDESRSGEGWAWAMGLCIVLLVLLAMAGGGSGDTAPAGTTTNTTTNTTEVNIFSNNRIFSPDTTVNVDSGNTATTQTSDNRTTIEGDRNTVAPVTNYPGLCYDAGQDGYVACENGVTP